MTLPPVAERSFIGRMFGKVADLCLICPVMGGAWELDHLGQVFDRTVHSDKSGMATILFRFHHLDSGRYRFGRLPLLLPASVSRAEDGVASGNYLQVSGQLGLQIPRGTGPGRNRSDSGREVNPPALMKSRAGIFIFRTIHIGSSGKRSHEVSVFRESFRSGRVLSAGGVYTGNVCISDQPYEYKDPVCDSALSRPLCHFPAAPDGILFVAVCRFESCSRHNKRDRRDRDGPVFVSRTEGISE